GVQLLKEAADAGYAVAQLRLAIFFENARYVDRDLDAATRYYTAAAEQGNLNAMYNLGVLLASGRAGPADTAAAAQWFRRAAELGSADAQFNFAVLMSEDRYGVANLAEGYRWYAIAAARGDADAAAQRDQLAAGIPPEERARLDAEVAAWKPRAPDPAVNREPLPSRSATNATVLTAQEALKTLGHYAGPADGILDSGTLAGLRAFAAAEGLPRPDGLTADLLARLTDRTRP
ncbi:MAG: SEL1-like repeat protein, partial [Alphaproteobacteria bacterium]|nr:SEL1-like repeat protein [Alphaproteobacteria bacterium]